MGFCSEGVSAYPSTAIAQRFKGQRSSTRIDGFLSRGVTLGVRAKALRRATRAQ